MRGRTTSTGWLYKISPDGTFEKGTYQPFAALYLIAGFVVLIVINLKKYRNCEKEDIVRMCLLFSLEAIAIILQIFEAEMFQDGFIGSALLIILYYDFVIEIESKYDVLTGVGSATYFNSYMDRIGRTDTYRLIMFDVNGLKHTNDTMGHEAGNKLISAIGQGIKAAVASYGKVFRVGGDEFMVVLLNPDEAVGKEIIKKANEIFKEKSEQLKMTVSAASGTAVCHANESVQDVKKSADEAMYACKQQYYKQAGNDRRSRDV